MRRALSEQLDAIRLADTCNNITWKYNCGATESSKNCQDTQVPAKPADPIAP